MKKVSRFALFFLFAGTHGSFSSAVAQEPLRLGLIGLDTSHVVAFTRILNNSAHPQHVSGGRVVAAYPGGSPDMPASANRLEGFQKTLVEEFHVEIVDSIPELLEKVDAVLLTSVDARRHLEQVRPVFAAGKRVYIDKPLAASLADAREIVRLSKDSGVPFFTSSSLRYFTPALEMIQDPAIGTVVGADTVGPAHLEERHPELYWYGIHGIEMLYAILGPGCESVTRIRHDDGEVVVGVWNDGRIGTYRGVRRGTGGFGARVIGEKGMRHTPAGGGSGYEPMLEAVMEFFRTGVSPVEPEEMLEIFEFMTAAHLSSDRGGIPVKLEELRNQGPRR